MKDFLQGKWLNHPLHPILVNLPTGLWPLALVFDLLSWVVADGSTMARTSFYAIVLGLLATLLAIPTGLADWSDIKPEKPARKLGWYHLGLNLAAMTAWVVNAWQRWQGGLDTAPVPALPLALSALGTLLLAAAAYLGGRMVYDHGIGIARTSKDQWRRLAEAGGARVPEEKG